jgi:hypothetical protein
MIEGFLESNNFFFPFIDFQEEENISPLELYAACARLNDENPAFLSSLDYVMAATDYEAFISLMLDYKVRLWLT